MEINKIIENFRNYINISWGTISKISTEQNRINSESFCADWLQFNWELMVESLILEPKQFLEVYGDGSDINGESSRVTYPEYYPTHKLRIKLKENAYDYLNNEMVDINISFDFDRFVNFKDNYYSESSNFDFILVLEQPNLKERVFSNTIVKYELVKLS
jgi:hypothetical protein